MSTRVAYWTSAFEVDMEAVAGEVATLRGAFPGSIAWGLDRRRWVHLSRRRGFSLHPRLHLAFRAATRLLQGSFDVNHLFGGLGDWFHLKAVRKRPTVLTMAVAGPVCDPKLLGKVDRFVVEWPSARTDLEGLGIEPGRVRLILPPVDTRRFLPRPAPAGPFTVVFASSPDDARWLEDRGVLKLLEAAALQPSMRFRLVWRPWGDSLPRVRHWIDRLGLANVEVVVGRFADMADHYAEAHATVAPFVRMGSCKPAPNSLLESLACGRPVLVTPGVGIAELVRDGKAGVVREPTGPALAEGLDRLRADWAIFSANGRRLAEARFAVETFLGGYRRLYDELTRS